MLSVFRESLNLKWVNCERSFELLAGSLQDRMPFAKYWDGRLPERERVSIINLQVYL